MPQEARSNPQALSGVCEVNMPEDQDITGVTVMLIG
jgi:hypothetical protein